jgi:hypothetical protein
MPRAPRITKEALAAHAEHNAAVSAARGNAAPAAPAPVPVPACVDYAAAWEQSDQLVLLMRHVSMAARARTTALRKQVDDLERIAKVGPYAPTPKAARPARVVPQDELDRVAAMALAKAKAMATGVSAKA